MTCPLTPRQVDIIQRLTDGTSLKGISSDMGISVVTIYNHLKNARIRAEATTTFELIAVAARQGWIY